MKASQTLDNRIFKGCCACGTVPAMSLCSGCKIAWFCSSECQREMWLNHKVGCIKDRLGSGKELEKEAGLNEEEAALVRGEFEEAWRDNGGRNYFEYICSLDDAKLLQVCHWWRAKAREDGGGYVKGTDISSWLYLQSELIPVCIVFSSSSRSPKTFKAKGQSLLFLEHSPTPCLSPGWIPSLVDRLVCCIARLGNAIGL